MVYGYLPEGTRVKVRNMFGDEYTGEIALCLYSCGIKFIGAGYKYYVKRDGEMFFDDNGGYEDYQVTEI